MGWGSIRVAHALYNNPRAWGDCSAFWSCHGNASPSSPLVSCDTLSAACTCTKQVYTAPEVIERLLNTLALL